MINMEISRTEIISIIRLLEQGMYAIEKYSPVTSTERDVARRMKQKIKKLKKRYDHVICNKGKVE